MIFFMHEQKEQLSQARHSCAHLLAAAVKQLWPGAKNAIGPAIEDGFYQDFDMGEVKISESDFEQIEKKMREILKTWGQFEVKEVSLEQAQKDFADNPYKLELIQDFGKEGKTITENNPGNFLDLCKGGHSDDPQKELQHFKLLKIAGAYWRGDEKRQMLTRIYGTCFPAQKELDNYLVMLEEAKKRDHRKLGKELDLFTFSDLIGKGLPLWTHRGATIRRELENFVVAEELRRGYLHVITPELAKVDLYRKSGHFPYYKNTMYPPMQIDEEELILRPMTCPHHFMLYQDKKRSYRELPMRIAELARLFRYEKSGELTGMMRVRSFCLADAHIICMPEQVKGELTDVLDLVEYMCSVFGLVKGKDFSYRLSLGDRENTEKYYKNDAAWDEGEETLRAILQERGAPFAEAQNEAAFYGPKIDIQMRNVLGKEDTAFTVQYDFCMPERFDLRYIDKDGTEKQPIVIHRSSIGAIERTFAFLIEHYAGAFPLWLAPVQVQFVPVSEKHREAVKTQAVDFHANGIRVVVDETDETVGNKIRKSVSQKIPYIVVFGDKEAAGEDWVIRIRGQEKQEVIQKEAFIARVLHDIATKRIF